MEKITLENIRKCPAKSPFQIVVLIFFSNKLMDLCHYSAFMHIKRLKSILK